MTKRTLRIEYGKFLVEMGKKYPNLIVLDGDLKESTQTVQFQEKFPERFIEGGVAEQNMFDVAAGLALGGKLPVVHTFACFASMRACEQIRTSICYPKLNVKIVVSHGGVSSGSAGTTHHSIEDIAIMRSLANMTIIAPGDTKEMRQAVEQAFALEGPVYIRLVAGEFEDVYEDKHNFFIGKATELRDGNDATIITTGTLMYEGVKASEILLKDYGIKTRVLQMASIKPIDKEAIIRAAEDTEHIITIEEHNIIGGLGSSVCEIIAEIGKGRVKRIGINDHFCETGSHSYLLNKEGITIDSIIKCIKELLKI